MAADRRGVRAPRGGERRGGGDRSRGWGARREPMVARRGAGIGRRGAGCREAGGRRPGGQSVGPPGPCSNSPRADVGRGILRGAGGGGGRGPVLDARALRNCARPRGPPSGRPGPAGVDVDSGRSAGARAPRGERRGGRDRSRGCGARRERMDARGGGSAAAGIVRGGGRRPGGLSVGPPGPCSNSPRAGVGRGILRGAGAVVGGDRCSTPGRCGTARGPGALPRAAQGRQGRRG
jgi:hypothetical protein